MQRAAQPSWVNDHLASRLRSTLACPVSVGRPGAETDLAVNATPMGVAPGDPIPIDLDALGSRTMVAEALIKPPITRLLVEAARRGHGTHEGRHMLDFQVASTWRFFGLSGLPNAGA